MGEESILKKIWPALSFALLLTFLNISLYIFLALKPAFPIYVTMVISNIFFVFISIFLELSGIRERLWKFWASFPVLVHKIICALCIFWICFLSLKALIPAIKKDYERN